MTRAEETTNHRTAEIGYRPDDPAVCASIENALSARFGTVAAVSAAAVILALVLGWLLHIDNLSGLVPDSTVLFEIEAMATRLAAGIIGVVIASSVVLYLWVKHAIRQRISLPLHSVIDRSEQRFRTLINNNADAILFIDADGVVRFANPTAARVFGRPGGDLIGQPFGFPLGNGESTTIQILDPKGAIRTAEMRYAAIDWENETALVASIRDVSDRVKQDRRLRESEAKFRALFENSKDAIFFCDRKGRILDCNRSTEVIFGQSREALKAASLVDYCADPEDHVRFQLEIETRGAVKDFAIQIVNAGGDTLECQATASILLSDQNDITGYQGILRDMSEVIHYRKNLELLVDQRTAELNRSLVATEEANKRIHGIIASVADGLIVTDKHRCIQLINPAAAALLSVSAEQAMGQPIDAVVGDEALRTVMLNCLTGKEDVDDRQYETEIAIGEGRAPTRVRAKTTPIAGIGDTSTGTVTLLSDVTHEHKIQRMKSEFISTAAHELRTPLTSICGFSEILLKQDALSEGERRRFLQYIYEQGRVLFDIINDLLDLSRMEVGAGFAVNKADADIANIVRSIADRFQLETGKHTFYLDLPAEVLVVYCDRGKIEQVLDNIYSNAVKYAPDGGVVETELTANGDWVEIVVSDNGIGMTPEQESQVFEKFYRADASNTAIAGTGLGMSIVRQIVEAHGGAVSVSSEKGVGTAVRVCLPVSTQEVALESSHGASQASLPGFA